MDQLGLWDDTPAVLLSAPGPARAALAAVHTLARRKMFQRLFGYEAAMAAFAAAVPVTPSKLHVLAAAEIFDGRESHAALAAAIVCPVARLDRVVHVRFGGVRQARVLKGARNLLAMPDQLPASPATFSRHPLASGRVVPAATEGVLTWEPGQALPRRLGTAVPGTSSDTASTPWGAALDERFLAADLAPRLTADPGQAGGSMPGLTLQSLSEFASTHWQAREADGESGGETGGAHDPDPACAGLRRVMVPWNLGCPGNAVTELLHRLQRLDPMLAPDLRIVLFPFNVQADFVSSIDRLARNLVAAAEKSRKVLDHVFVARVTDLRVLPSLRRLFPLAWVEGNDVEARWTLRRLAALRIASILIDPTPQVPLPPGCGALTVRLPADRPTRIQAQTEFGLLSHEVVSLSPRGLSTLIAQSHALLPPLGSPPAPPAPPVPPAAVKPPRRRSSKARAAEPAC